MEEIWAAMTPPLRADDIVKLAIGPKHAEPLELNKREAILAELAPTFGTSIRHASWMSFSRESVRRY